MSSTSTPKSDICPECGAINLPYLAQCYLCGHALGTAATGAVSGAKSGAPLPPEDAAVPIAGADATGFVLVIALAILCIGAGSISPGLGIALAVVLTPALVRTLRISAEKRQRGTPPTALEVVAAGFGSVLVIVTVGVAAAATFYGVCWAGFLGGAAASSPFAKGYDPIGYGFVTGGIAGTVAGISVGVFLLRRLWPRKKT